MQKNNYMEVTFPSLSVNEGFARVCVAAFCLQLNPSVDEINDIKTAVSEAVTNCVVHAYPKTSGGLINLKCETQGQMLIITVSDNGVGIKDIEKAREPFYTTKPSEERSGMGFAVMESFMDKVEVEKNDNKGTKVVLYKRISRLQEQVKNA